MTDRSNISTLSENIRKGIEGRLKELHTALPGIVESFDPEMQLATVQPAIRRIFITRDGEKEILVPTDLPLLINVPVIFPRGGKFSLTFPVEKGDECLLVFNERSIDNWHETGKTKVPTAYRLHSLSDATAFVGLSSKPNKIPDYDPVNTQLKRDDGSVKFTILTDGTMELYADAKVTIDTPETEITGNLTVMGNTSIIGNTAMTGSLAVTGTTNLIAPTTVTTITSNGINIAGNHTHPPGTYKVGNENVTGNSGNPQ